MGIGDDLMCAGEARKARERDPKKRPCHVHKRPGRVCWREVWSICPDIVPRATVNAQPMMNYGPGKRGYIDYPRSRPNRWAWKDYEPTPARIDLPEPVITTGKILIEPNLKASAPPGKQWGWRNWQELVDRYPGDFLQIGAPGTRVLNGVDYVPTRNFTEALRYLAGCRAAVLPEGGLHHAAAAFAVPAVVLFGAYITPRSTGYDYQTSLWVDDPEAQGWRVHNERLAAAWKRIPVDMVLEAVDGVLNERASRSLVAGSRGAPDRAHGPEPQAL